MNFEKEISKAENLIAKDRLKSAIGKLRKIYDEKSLSEKERNQAALLLSVAYRKNQQTDKAMEILQNIQDNRPDDYFLELGETYLEQKKYENALEASRCYDEKSGEGNLLFARALWLKARADFNLKYYKDCMDVCQAVLKYDPFSGTSETALDENMLNSLVKLKNQAEELFKQAREIYDVFSYGKDFSWYRKGREAEFEGDYENAIKFYNKIKRGILKDAASCYIGHCLAKSGDFKSALKQYSEFYESSPFGLYRGEALYSASLLSFCEIKGKKGANEALKFIEKFRDWLSYVQIPADEIALPGINKKVKEDIIDKNPITYLEKNACGNLVRAKQYPENIINRLTSPWYLNELETKAELFYAFLLGETGETNKAASAYKHAEETGGNKIISSDAVYPVLLAGLVNGVYLLPRDYEKKLSSKNYNRIMLANFLYCSEEKQAAEAIYDSYLKGEHKHKRYDTAAILLGKAYCCLASNKQEEAVKILKSLYKDSSFSKMQIGRQAAFLHACLLSQSDKKKAYRIFDSVADEKDCEFAPQAMLALAVCAVNYGDKNLAETTCTRIRESYPKTPFSEAAVTLRKALKHGDDNELIACVDTPDGKIIRHRRTLVIPGTSKWDISGSGLRAGDLILYRIKCVGNGPCSIIRSVKIYLTPEEPQPPAKRGNETIFVRAPVLYAKGLIYDFDEKFPDLNNDGQKS